MIGEPRVGLTVALRRVLLGYRVVALVWLWLLAGVVLVTEDAATTWIFAAGTAAAAWTGVTAWMVLRRPAQLRSLVWVGFDIVVSATVILVATGAGADRGFTGGYPFSTVLFASYGAGVGGGVGAAVVLSVVSLRLGVGEVIGSSLIYAAGAGVSAWGIGVLLRYDRERRELEARLADERAERVRSQERAETAAALHDGVLQTLALMQRRRDDPDAVASLARRQERDLRDWLRGAPGRRAGLETFSEAVKDVVAAVEAEHPLSVEVVTVGDAPLTHAVEALVAAAGEALRNVAKHAGVANASLYAEVGEEGATVFVRDRGAGFDPEAVPWDRRGISESIVGRMRRHGGTAAVRSTPGSGTEVQLRLSLPGTGAPEI